MASHVIYLGLVTGALPVDLGIGRRVRPLGPQRVDIAAPPDLVFDVIAAPYLTVAASLEMIKSEAERRGIGMTRITAGQALAARELPTLSGAVIVPDPTATVHLRFRRYANCPICNLHLRSFAARHVEIAAAGVREVVVFHSDRAALAEHQARLPFDAVPDPHRALYREFGVTRSALALLRPGTWWAAIRGWRPSLGLRSGPGGHFGLPADFLIGPDGRVLASKYGTHANDQWSVDDVLALVNRATDHRP